MADNGWVYRYDFKNGDCYVGKEGSFDPFIRATEHLQDALAVAYPEKYTGFKMLFRGTSAKYLTINRYSEAKVQKLGWQWGYQGREKSKGVKFTHKEIEDIRKNSRGTGVRSVYWTVEEDEGGRKDIWGREKEKFETRGVTNFKNVLEDIYNSKDERPTGDYADLLNQVENWRYISVKDIRKMFQVTPAEITWLENTAKKTGDLKKINLTKVLNVIFGKEDEKTKQRSKTNDWINIFYTEVQRSGQKGRKAGASLLDVCEMFATLSAYYELGTGKIVNSEGEPGEMLNNEILMTDFSSLTTGKQQSIGQAITESIDLQKALGQKGSHQLLKDIITKLGKQGDKAGKNVKDLYKVASSQIASLITRRIQTTNIWQDKGEKQKEEMFKRVFALLTNSTFSSFSDKDYRKRFDEKM